MSRPVDYCTVEFDFLTGGSNCTFMSMTAAQRFAYICAWSYAVHLRKSYLSNYEIEHRLGAIYDIDRRTVAKMLQTCCKDAKLMVQTKTGYDIAGVVLKHGKLKGFTALKVPSENEKPEDSIGIGIGIVQDSIEEKHGPDLFPETPVVLKPKKNKMPNNFYDIVKDEWNRLAESSGLEGCRVMSKDRMKKVDQAYTFDWFRSDWKQIFKNFHDNEWRREHKASFIQLFQKDNLATFYESNGNTAKKPIRQRESFERENKKYPEGEVIHNGMSDM